MCPTPSPASVPPPDPLLFFCPVCGAHESQKPWKTIGSEVPPYRTFLIVQCGFCAHRYLDPLPDPEELSCYYNADYAPYQPVDRDQIVGSTRYALLKKMYGSNGFGSALWRGALGWLLPEYPLFVPHGRFLDIGCGAGRNLLEMRLLGWQCTGLDYNTSISENMRQYEIDLISGDVLASLSQLPDSQFDAALCCHALEHFADPMAVIRHVARILKPGGQFQVVVPCLESPFARFAGDKTVLYRCPSHLQFFSRASLFRALRENQFRVTGWGSSQTEGSLLALCKKGSPVARRTALAARLITKGINLLKMGDVLVARASKPGV